MVAEEGRMKGEVEQNPRPQTTEPSNAESMHAAIDLKAEGSNQLKQNDRSASPSSLTNNSNTAESISNGNKATYCRGCLYYSSRFKANSRSPLCVGLSGSLPRVPQDVIGKSEMEASEEDRGLTDFRYACVGYSFYMNQEGPSFDGQQTQTELPICAGIEVLVDRSVNTADSTSAPTHIHNVEDSNGWPQRRLPKPSNSTGDEFLSRINRNANLVANGVAKNVLKAGNQIKQSLDDILSGK